MLNVSNKIVPIAVLTLLGACAEPQQAAKPVETTATAPAVEQTQAEATAPSQRSLDDVLASQSEDTQARYEYRNPKQTLEFFEIEPGMTVVEALPGGGWYSKILLPYLGKNGSLIGVDYAHDMWQHFGGFATPEFIEKRKTWPATWAADAEKWRDEGSASIAAYQFGDQADATAGTADAVLFFRALHNLARFQDKAPYLANAIKDSYTVLKPGGIVGVVQHQALEDRPDDWANGSNGYLKQSMVIKAFEEQGFEFVADSDINANPADQAGEGDVVWRLPPSFAGAQEGSPERDAVLAIGESNRMTLKFRKPL